MSGRKPSAKPARSGSGRPTGEMGQSSSQPRLHRGSSSRSVDTEASGFNAKEAGDFLAARVYAAQERYKRWSDLSDEQKKREGQSVHVYQGEQRAWGGARSFNPVKDDFLQLVEIAVDAFKQTTTTGHQPPIPAAQGDSDE